MDIKGVAVMTIGVKDQGYICPLRNKIRYGPIRCVVNLKNTGIERKELATEFGHQSCDTVVYQNLNGRDRSRSE
jgi:hypothetical protein